MSTKLARRLSWKGAVALGFALFLIVGVAIPLGMESWIDSREQVTPHSPASRIMFRFDRLILMRVILPMKVIGSVGAIICWLIAIWKLLKVQRDGSVRS